MTEKILLLAVLLSVSLTFTSGSERRTKYGCEGGSMAISCEEGTSISIVRANFGRFSISICNELGNTTWSTHCIQPTTLRALTARCGGKQECMFDVNASVFGDPCPTTYKYMEVHYYCQQQFTTTAEPHAQPPWLLDLSATPPPRRRPSTTTTTTTTTSTTTSTASTTSTTTQKPTEKTTEDNERLYVLESLVDHCPPVTVRNLFWNWTRSGDLAIQPCPGGSSGFAKWRCSTNGGWFSGSPDLSECESSWLTRLTARLREGEDVLDLASELADASSARTMYGGDVSRVAELMSSLAHRLRQDLFSIPSESEKERMTGELDKLLVETGSNLLEDSQSLGWADLDPASRASAGSDLVLALQENAFLHANSINVEQDVVTVENNIVAATRIMRAREIKDQEFTSTDFRVHINIPSQALVENSENGAIRLLFFYYNNMDHILPSSTNGIKFLNSQVASAALSRGHSITLNKPLTATFKHTEVGSMSNPTCVWWDFVSKTWSTRGCWSTESNVTHTSCQCSHLANMAVLMEETTFAAPHSDQSTGAMTVVIAAIVSVVICLVTLTTTFIIFRRFSKSVCGGNWPCIESKEQRGSGGYYPYLSSSTTTTTLTPPTPGAGGEGGNSQYCLQNECQVLRPLMITPLGPNSTIYRATFANGQQAHVIPISGAQNGGGAQTAPRGSGQKNFRPITPSASHIYMEIDPVYNSETLSDILVSDLSDDDLRRSSEEGGVARQYPPSQNSSGGDVQSISNTVCDQHHANNGEFNAPISTTYTDRGQQLLRLDLKGSHIPSYVGGGGSQNGGGGTLSNFGQFNQFQQPNWQRQVNHSHHVFQ